MYFLLAICRENKSEIGLKESPDQNQIVAGGVLVSCDFLNCSPFYLFTYLFARGDSVNFY